MKQMIKLHSYKESLGLILAGMGFWVYEARPMVKRTKTTHKQAALWQCVQRYLPTPSQMGALLATITFLAAASTALIGRDAVSASDTVSYEEIQQDPAELTATDRSLYTMIDEAQDAKDYKKANALIERLANKQLVGYVLAERYLSRSYNPSREELRAWLDQYPDHPQAPRIAILAARQGIKVALPKTEKPLKGDGYGEHAGRTSMPDIWYSGLARWREGNYASAGAIFTKVSANDNLPDWQLSAAHYWSYRANTKLGKLNQARDALKQAAEYNTTFYGLLANQQLGAAKIIAEAPEVSPSLRHDPRAIRAAMLNQLGRNDEAENELRALYSATSKGNRPGIITLASEMNMPNLQIRLSRMQGLSKSESLFAGYPAPQYMVELDPVMDSALLLAVARNESGFREVAHNRSSGALGMMQMLPSTARAVERHVGEELLQYASADSSAPLSKRLSNPALSARYGAEYLKLLTQQPAIRSNLIHTLIGYNAGPGTAANWKRNYSNITDPLLYIESIPYAETRNYVMHVSAQYWIYQLMMDEKPASLKALAKGQWPSVAPAPVATASNI